MLALTLFKPKTCDWNTQYAYHTISPQYTSTIWVWISVSLLIEMAVRWQPSHEYIPKNLIQSPFFHWKLQASDSRKKAKKVFPHCFQRKYRPLLLCVYACYMWPHCLDNFYKDIFVCVSLWVYMHSSREYY